MRFQLNVYEKRKPKGKAISKESYETPLAARIAAREAKYFEIVDLTDKRIIEVKLEE